MDHELRRLPIKTQHGDTSYWTTKSDKLLALEREIEELIPARDQLQNELRVLTWELIDKQLHAARLRHTTERNTP